MNNKFLEIFQQNLINDDFSRINFSFDKNNIICFFKQVGNNLYIILPIEAKINYREFFIHCENHIKKTFFNQSLFKIFLLEIVISRDSSSELINFATYNSNFENNLTKLKWLINLTENKIISYGNQPSHMLNISNLIEKCFYDESNKKPLQENPQIIQSDLKKNNTIILTTCIIFAIFFIHFYTLSLGIHQKLINLWATSPFTLANKEYYRLFTSSFLHADLGHLLSNFLSLYIFGSRVERYLGKLNFLIIYVFGMLISSLASCFFVNAYSIGASGAIFALEGAILYYSIKTKKTVDGLTTSTFVLISCLGILTGFSSHNINNLSHIVGFICGILVSCILLLFKKQY